MGGGGGGGCTGVDGHVRESAGVLLRGGEEDAELALPRKLKQSVAHGVAHDQEREVHDLGGLAQRRERLAQGPLLLLPLRGRQRRVGGHDLVVYPHLDLHGVGGSEAAPSECLSTQRRLRRLDFTALGPRRRRTVPARVRRSQGHR